ncbi:hypothetical protein MKX03_000628 [Papaver bracteatum]|nr:hypothetical protein MKX03_000628 [Papaver bracteatum]
MAIFSRNVDVALIGAWCSVRFDPMIGNWQGETVRNNNSLQQRVKMFLREVISYVRFVRHYFMNLPNGWDNERAYEQGRRDYEEDGRFPQKWRYDVIYDLLKLHFPLVYDPEILVLPANIPPPRDGGEI